jgi:hypothetical protein
MADKEFMGKVVEKASNRRSFVKKLGLASAALGVAATGAKAQAPAGITDADVLNFALNLEYLEAEFYTYATTGKGIDSLGFTITGSGTAGATTGGSLVTFTDPTVAAIAAELAADEQIHVALLQEAISDLGGTAISKPAINLAALGFGFGSQAEFLTLARIFEDVGVTAYAGAAGLLTNPVILGYASRILAVEAEHVGNIRLLVAQNKIATTALDGADIIPPPTGTKYFSVDSNALVETRTPQQVLLLTYGAANATSGGFYPSGVNGLVNTSAAAPATLDGASFTASPNPIPLAAGTLAGQTTITWNAPSAKVIQVRVGSPNGALLTDNNNSGSMQTGNWVSNGMMFFLQDVTLGKPLTAANTLATLTVTTTAAS